MDTNKRSERWRTVAALAVGALVISAFAASLTLAKGPSPRPLGSEKCWVLPDPVARGAKYTVYGSGFRAGAALNVFVGSGTLLTTASDPSGNFSVWDYAAFQEYGTKQVTVVDMYDRKKTPLATCSFVANP